MNSKKYQYGQPHLLRDKAFYSVTATTHNQEPFFAGEGHKQILLEAIEKRFGKYRWRVDVWVIFDNHYHLIAAADKSSDLPEIIRKIHGVSARAVNRLEAIPGRKVWGSYRQTCLRDSEDYENYLAYLYWNPVEHGLVKSPMDYSWSSFSRKGRIRDSETANLEGICLLNGVDNFA